MSINYSKRTPSLVETGLNGGSLVPFESQPDTLTYEPFFGLTEKPFSLNSDARFVFESPTYGSTREGLLAGIRRREGLLVLTGEIGTGKTTLCHAVLRDLGRKTYRSMVPDPFASREDLLKMLLIDFGVMSIQELTTGRLREASRTELSYLLAEFLDSLPADAFAVVMIDEAQNLTLPLIEETRILSDSFGAAGRLQIVFVGQPELHAKLKLPEMRQVDQRVCGYHRLAPMSRAAVEGYIQHRLAVAGGRPDRVLFPASIIDALQRRTGGVARLINRVCDRALLLAHERRAGAVDQEILETVLIEVGSTTLSPTWDSIVFSEPPAPPIAAQEVSAPAAAPPPAPEPAAAQVEVPVPAAVPVATVAAPVAPLSDDDFFAKDLDQWVDRELAPPSRSLSPVFTEVSPEQLRAWRRAPRTVPSREVPSPKVASSWPVEPRPLTRTQKFLRTWAKRTAIAAVAFMTVIAGLVGASMLPSMQAAPVLPAVANQPATPEAEIVPAEAPQPVAASTEAPGAELPAASAPVSDAATPSAVPVSESFLIAVGLFGSPARADQLVDALTQAGLPAMQRPFQLRQRAVQQIVLGPFFTRAEAVADLRRLQALGGYDDASVIDGK